MDALASRIVDAIIRDLTDRGGLDGAWDSIDDDTQDEIRETWIQLVIEESQK